MTELQERFLRKAAERLPLERVVEVHLFPPIRQGGMETGIAIVAAEDARGDEAAAMAADDEVPDPEALAEGDVLAEEIAEAHGRQPRRHTVYTARYRATLKGPERGRFEVDVHEEADAPLITIDAVVRGVQHRAGEPTEPERLTGERLRGLAAPVGTK